MIVLFSSRWRGEGLLVQVPFRSGRLKVLLYLLFVFVCCVQFSDLFLECGDRPQETKIHEATKIPTEGAGQRLLICGSHRRPVVGNFLCSS